MLFIMFILAILLTAAAGIYSIIATRNLIRVLIAMELVSKATILLLLLAGLTNGQMAFAESLIVALIIIEVVVTAIGAVLCIALYSRTGSLEINIPSKLKEELKEENHAE